MARTFKGTFGNDTFVGVDRDVNIFTGIGIGSDRATGGSKDESFGMLVDRHVDFVDGGAGRDAIDYSKSSVGLNIDLARGSATADLDLLLRNVTVTQIQNVEDVVGSQFDDTIIGTTAANTLDGGAGNDEIHAGAGNDTLVGGTGHNLLDGGRGTDTADYASANHAVFADLGNGSATQTDLTTGDTFAQDMLVSIENVTGSRFGDHLQGSSGDNMMNGGDGNDFIYGGAGDDTINGDNGNDVIGGGGGSDTIHGNGGSDELSAGEPGSNGKDRLFGDDGNDVLAGNVGDDLLFGGADNDTLFGNDGIDFLDGGDGNDYLEGGRGGDLIDGGAGIDTLVYRFSEGGVTVNLGSGTASGGDANGDTFYGVENIWGSRTGNDTLIGSNGDNTFVEEGGNNILFGGGGSDTFTFMSSATPSSNTVLDFQVGVDRLALFDNGLDDLGFSETAAGTTVTYGAGDSVLLVGVHLHDLQAHAATDIIFVDSLKPVLDF